MDIKEAIAKAKEYAAEIFDKEVRYVRLEEISFDKEDKVWRVTFGYDSTRKITRKKGLALYQDVEEESLRDYRTFELSEAGEFIRMFIREV